MPFIFFPIIDVVLISNLHRFIEVGYTDASPLSATLRISMLYLSALPLVCFLYICIHDIRIIDVTKLHRYDGVGPNNLRHMQRACHVEDGIPS